MYSGNLEIPNKLCRKVIKKIYEKRGVEATRHGEYMGIFQNVWLGKHTWSEVIFSVSK